MKLNELGYDIRTIAKIAYNLGKNAYNLGIKCSSSLDPNLSLMLNNMDLEGGEKIVNNAWMKGWAISNLEDDTYLSDSEKELIPDSDTEAVEDIVHTSVEGSYDFNTTVPPSFNGGTAILGNEPYSYSLESEEGIIPFPMLGEPNNMNIDIILDKANSEGLSEVEIKKILIRNMVESKLNESEAYKDFAIIHNALNHLIQISGRNPLVITKLNNIKKEIKDVYGDIV